MLHTDIDSSSQGGIMQFLVACVCFTWHVIRILHLKKTVIFVLHYIYFLHENYI